jgi:exonuclease V
MQLMLYHHLLSALLSPTFSFNIFWEKIQVDPSAQFSDEFLLQAGLARETDGKVVLGYPACLDDLTDLWRSTVHSLRVRGVSPTLEIVYRKQPKHSAASGASRPSTSDEFALADQEARDLARTIAASLREHERDPDLERAIAESLLDTTPAVGSSATLANDEAVVDTTSLPPSEGLSDRPDIPWYSRSGTIEGVVDTTSLRPTEGLPDRPDIPWYSRSGTTEGTQSKVLERAQPVGTWNIDELGSLGLPTPTLESARIIGRKSFVFDEEAMNAYVEDVLQWWRGKRPPRGVDVEHSHRCL